MGGGYRFTTSLASFGASSACKMLEIYTSLPRDLVADHLVRRGTRRREAQTVDQLTRETPCSTQGKTWTTGVRENLA
eukprot:3615559-Pyramimonas_sp.AAC.1